MVPLRLAAGLALGGQHGLPPGQRLAHAARPHLDADGLREHLLCRAAGRAAAAQHLAQRLEVRQLAGQRLGGDVVDPRLDQCEGGRELLEGTLLRGAAREDEHLLGPARLHRLRVREVQVPHHLVERVEIQGDPAGVVLDRGEQGAAQPRRGGEQGGVRDLAGGEEDPRRRRVEGVRGDEVLDVRGDQRRLAVAAERQPQVRGAGDLPGQRPDRVAELDAEHRPADALHHPGRIAAAGHLHPGRAHRAEIAHLPHLRADRLADGARHVLRDRLHDRLPARQGAREPGAAAVHLQLRGGHVDREHRVQPEPRHLRRLAQLGDLLGRRARIARRAGRRLDSRQGHLAGGGATREVLRHLPVHGAVALGGEEVLHLGGGRAQLRGVLGEVRLLREGGEVQPVQRPLGERVPEGLLQEALQRLLVHVTGSTRDRGIAHGHLLRSVGSPGYRPHPGSALTVPPGAAQWAG